MKHRTVVALTVAALLAGALGAYAAPPFTSTVSHGGAYDITINMTGSTSYSWEVTFNGIDTGFENERIRAFALYELPALPTATEAATYTSGSPDRSVYWSTFSVSTGSHGNTVIWQAMRPTGNRSWSDAAFVGETVGLFETTFASPLPDDYFTPYVASGVHVQFGEDSEWVNNTPEPVSAVLLALGIPVALAARRRRTQ